MLLPGWEKPNCTQRDYGENEDHLKSAASKKTHRRQQDDQKRDSEAVYNTKT